MDQTSFAKDITAEDLRVFLDLWPLFAAEYEEVHQILVDDKERLLNEKTGDVNWCYWYELPIKQHIALFLTTIIQNYVEILPAEQVVSWFKQLVDSPSQIGALPGVVKQVENYFNESEEPSKEVAEAILPNLAGILGGGFSLLNSLRCVLYHGCFMNDLIDRVRADNDKALFDAVRIDSTVLGCFPVVERISKAALLQDNRFFAKLKGSINGKQAKREQANFQKMRLVFQVLHEAGATRLSDAQLHELFVEELKLYSGNAKGGGNAKALRKFADTYMKKSATT